MPLVKTARRPSWAGVRVTPIILGSFVISSLLAGICGIMLGGYFGGASRIWVFPTCLPPFPPP